MTGKIFMYLFIFTVLLVVFQYMNSKHILDSYEVDIKKSEVRVKRYKDSIDSMQETITEMRLFNLEFDDNAINYFQDDNYNSTELNSIIKDELYKLNDYVGENHPVVPYASKTNHRIRINSIRVLNHKWLVANFTDGKYPGQILLSYEFNELQKLNFKLIESFLYPKD